MEKTLFGLKFKTDWNASFLLRTTVSTFVGLLAYLTCLPVTAAPVMLGVVRSKENSSQWQGIQSRLEAAQLTYWPLELDQLDGVEDLAGVNVLFLPNVQALTPTQTIALEAWMSQGGRLIVSGPVGSLSSLGVRQMLRSLLGAYWSNSLPQPTQLQLTTKQSSTKSGQELTSSRLWGGVVVPTGLESRTVAVWSPAKSEEGVTNPRVEPPTTSAAVITTERSTFLGWQWGTKSSGSPEFDVAWLKSTLNRYGEVLAQAPAKSSPPTRAKPTPAAEATDDPAEEVAPAGLEVAPSNSPINRLEAIALRRELENLIGRVESALLAANAVNSPTSLVAPDSAPVAQLASISPELPSASPKETLPGRETVAQEPSIQERNLTAPAEARQLLRSFLERINQKDYSGARQQWLQAQQLLRESYPLDRLQSQPEVRSIWLDRGTIVKAGSEQGLVRIFDQLAAAGINTVFFETLNAGYPIYPSRVAPQQNPLVKGWDPLGSAVKLAHERGIELHAWVWVFAVGNRPHNALLNLPLDYPGPVLTAHPNWANYDNRGQTIPVGQGKPFLDPANPEVRQYLTKLFSEIITRYPVDGLQLDYIRYPFQDPSADRTYGYGNAAREQFQSITGVDPATISPRDPVFQPSMTRIVNGKPVPVVLSPEEIGAARQRNRELWQQWTEFRIEQVNSFVAETSKQLRQLRPNIIISAAVFPLPPHDRLNKIQQHWEVWAKRGDVDLIVPMSYALDTNRFQKLVAPYLTQKELNSTLIVPGIRILNLPETLAIDQIQSIRDLPGKGYALFAAQDFNPQLQTVFSKTQGATRRLPKEPIPYRQPFTAAHARYAALKREWSFLLSNKQLQMRQPTLDTWRTQATNLEQELNQLANRPSTESILKARKSLDAFQTQFRGWMRLHALNHEYQVQTWEYRLAAIANLLSYGERASLKK